MNDSLKYGLPAGFISFGLLYANSAWFIALPSIVRLVFEVVLMLMIVLYVIKRENRAYFPFSFAFFSGFNVLFAGIATKAVMMIIFRDVLSVEPPTDIAESKWLAYIIFRESVSHLVLGMIALTAIAWLITKAKRK